MPMNNNQKVQSAAARLAKLPMVRSACAKLSVLYVDTKRSHPSLKSVCEVLENSVTALGTAATDRASPVILKLQPQISFANDVACKSLDWLETTFPVVHAPTEQIVAGVKNKMLEIQDVVGIAASGTMEYMQHTVYCAIARMQQCDDQANHSLVERAVRVASVGLDSALTLSETFVDRVLPPTEEEKEEPSVSVAGFEATALSSPVRVMTLTIKLCRRTYKLAGTKLHSVEVMESLSRSSSLFQISWLSMTTQSILQLPQYLQHQVVSILFFVSQMSTLSCPPSQHNQSFEETHRLSVIKASSACDVSVQPQTPPNWRIRRPVRSPLLDIQCKVKGCVR